MKPVQILTPSPNIGSIGLKNSHPILLRKIMDAAKKKNSNTHLFNGQLKLKP